MNSAEEDDDLLNISKIQRRTLIEEIRNILQQYPDNSQIFKEIVQNAEDASASEVIFLYDESSYDRNGHFSATGLSSFQGPALVVYNDGLFTKEDWKGIVSLGISFKAQAPLKVGRFGLGFKSIFHLTDLPSIMSGSYYAYIDPQKDIFHGVKENKEVHMVKLGTQMNSFPDEFKWFKNLPDNIKMKYDGRNFTGTLFRFPLRNVESEISQTIYNDKKMLQLTDTFKKEGCINTLFLKNVRNLSFYSVKASSNKKMYEIKHVDDTCLQKQKQFADEIKNSISKKEYKYDSLNIKIELQENDFISGSSKTKRYLVSESFGEFKFSSDKEFSSLIRDEQLSYVPLLGIAYPLQKDDISGHLFCGLPLPLSQKTLTGLPFHVNGYFSLSQDRKDLNWATHYTNDKSKSIKWNESLLQNLLPITCKNLFRQLNDGYEVEKVYNFFPNKIFLDKKWSPFINVVWTELAQENCCFIRQEQKWLSTREVTILNQKKLSIKQYQTLSKLFENSKTRVITLPNPIFEILSEFGQIMSQDSAIIAALKTTVDLYKKCNKEEQNCIIKFILSKPEHLQKIMFGFQLFKLTNGTYGCINSLKSNALLLFTNEHPKEVLHNCPYIIDNNFYHPATLDLMNNVADKGSANIKLVDSVEKVIKELQSYCQSPNFNPTFDWTKSVWLFCYRESFQLHYLENLPVVPIFKHGSMQFEKLTRSSKVMFQNVQNLPKLPLVLVQFLEKLGVEFVSSQFPDTAVKITGINNYFVFPDFNGVANILQGSSLSNYDFTKELRDVFIALLSHIGSIPPHLKDLKLFEDLVGNFVSINNCRLISAKNLVPDWKKQNIVIREAFPDAIKSKCICQTISSEEIIDLFLSSSCNITEKQNLFLLSKVSSERFSEGLLTKMKKYIFFKTKSGCSVLAKDLFQRNQELQEFFYGEENKFAHCTSNIEQNAITNLKLKTMKDVTRNDIEKSINFIAENSESLNKKDLMQKVKAIVQRCSSLNIPLQWFSQQKWIPVQVRHDRNYPHSLSWKGNKARAVESLNNLYHNQYAGLAGSQLLFIDESLEKNITNNKKPDLSLVLNHAKQIEKCYTDDEKGLYRNLIYKIYDYLASQPSSPVTLLWKQFQLNIWNDNNFVNPAKIVLKELEIDMAPYYYECCKQTFEKIPHVLERLCCQKSQIDLCVDVLEKLHLSDNKDSGDLQFAIKLVKYLADNNDAHSHQKSIYIPIENSNGVLQFALIEQCCYHDFQGDIDTTSYNIVSRFIPAEVSIKLGVKNLVSQILGDDECENDFEEWGQVEPLTLRINKILKDYEDGLPIFKEILQNAEDAGATSVHFMYDLRNNDLFKSSLICQDLAEWQGPALWVQNDALFTEKDFVNITKINAGTKSSNTDKIGQFGLGFNSVYNLTDLPFILSGNDMLIFDPHKKYLGRGLKSSNHTGKRIRFNSNQKLSPFRHQFQIFDEIFGCEFNEKTCGISYYQGSLFRLPLRKESTAKVSEIRNLAYTEREMELLIKKLGDSLHHLILFTDNIKKVTFSKMFQDKRVEEIFCVQKSERIIKSVFKENNLLKEVSKHMITMERVLHNQADKLTKFCIKKSDITVIHRGKRDSYEWITDAFVCSSKTVQHAKKVQNVIPCGGLAFGILPFIKNGEEKVSNINKYFCFLPLPLSSNLPVCVNGYFALTNDRKNFQTINNEVKHQAADWNRILAEEIGMGYYHFLCYVRDELVQQESDPQCIKSKYEAIFPTLAQCQCKQNVTETILQSFVKNIVNNSENIFPCISADQTQVLWKSWENIAFVPDILSDICNEVCFVMNKHFESKKVNSYLVKQDENFMNAIKTYTWEQYDCKKIDEKMFYKVFFNNINEWQLHPSIFQSTLLFLLKQHANDGCLYENIKSVPCIPTLPNNTLKLPKQLVKEGSPASELFSENDEVFPSHQYKSECEYLQKLGMDSDILSWEKVLDRANFIAMSTTNHKVNQSKKLLHLIEKKILLHEEDVPSSFYLEELSQVSFLPALERIESTQKNWYVKGNLVKATETFTKEYKNIVSCSAAVLDFDISDRLQSYLNLNKIPKEFHLVKMFQEVKTIFNHHGCNNDVVDIIDDLLEFLNKQHNHNQIRSKDLDESILIYSQNREAVVSPTKLFFELDKEIPNFLYKVPSNMYHKYFDLLRSFGTPVSPALKDYLQIVTSMQTEYLNTPLSEEMMQILVHSIYPKMIELNESYITNDFDIAVPNSHSVLQLASKLHYSDAKWMKLDSPIVHSNISKDMARDLGVKGLRNQFVTNKKVTRFAFGQKSDLVVRIKSILQGYTHADFLSEIIQNADDAGGTELSFMLDYRNHGTESVLSDEWKKLQGPSLLTWNNGLFSEKDLKSIQEIGASRKKDSALFTGKYGVGFNAVYTITDCPTMIAKVEETDEQILTIFDPTQQYTDNVTPGEGLYYEEVHNNFPDMINSHCIKEIGFVPNTLFRMPLRGEGQVEQLGKTLGLSKIEFTLKQLMIDCEIVLLFLKHIKKISFKFIRSSSDIESHAYLIKETSCKNSIVPYNRIFEPGSLFENFERYTKNFCITHFADEHICCSNHYNVIEQLGFSNPSSEIISEINSNQRKDDVKLTPKGGIAVKSSLKCDQCKRIDNSKRLEKCDLKKLMQDIINTKSNYNVFCTLPIPENSGLPVLINGNFCLEYETRNSLWIKENDFQYIWNNAIIQNCVLPCYIDYLLDYAKNGAFLKESIKKYFPKPSEKKYWSGFVTEFYKRVYDEDLPLIPVFIKTNDEKDNKTRYCHVKSEFIVYDLQDRTTIISMLMPGEPKLLKTLKNIGVTINKCEHFITENFVKVERGLSTINPSLMRERLKCLNDQIIVKKNLNVSESKFQSVDAVKTVLDYCCQSESDDEEQPCLLNGLPLCLLEDETITSFSPTKTKILSKFADLFASFSDKFVNTKLIYNLEKFVHDFNCLCVKSLDVSTFLEFLPQIIQETEYKDNGEVQVLRETSIMNIDWLTQLWKFIGETFKPDELVDLNDWCLVPCQRKDDQCLLPMSKINCILSLMNKDSPIEKVLKNYVFYVPLINEDVFDKAVLDKFFGNANSLKNLVDSLSFSLCNLESVNLKKDEARKIVHHLNSLFHNEGEKNNEVIQKLRNLPIFETFSGNLSSLKDSVILIPGNVPINGIEKFAKCYDKTVLKQDEFQDIAAMLNGSKVNINTFYEKFIPVLESLPYEDILVHLNFLSFYLYYHNDSEEVCNSLKQARIIKTKNGSIKPCHELYDPHHDVFSLIINEDLFPCQETFKDSKLQSLLRKIGLTYSIDKNNLVKCAKLIESKEDLEKASKASQLICENYLKSIIEESVWKRDETVIYAIKDINFIFPAKFKELENIHCSINSRCTRISIEGSVANCKKYLVWTTRRVLPSHFPHFYFDKKAIFSCRIMEKQRENIPIEDILQNIQNITNKLHPGYRNSLKLLPSNDPKDPNMWRNVLEKIFQYFDNAKNDYYTGELAKLSIIPTRNGRLDDAKHAVINDETKLQPYISKIDSYFGKYFPLFKSLGCSENPTALHFVMSLQDMFKFTKETKYILDPKTTKEAETAINGLVKCLKSVEKLPQNLEHLYIISTSLNKGEDLQLTLSRDTVFITDYSQASRFNKMNKRFLPSHYNEVNGKEINEAFLKYLPDKLKPKYLHEISEEVLVEAKILQLEDDNCSFSRLQKHLKSQKFIEGLKRIFRPENTCKTTIKDLVSSIEINVVESCETRLLFEGNLVENSNMEQPIFIKLIDDKLKCFVSIKESNPQNISTQISSALVKLLEKKGFSPFQNDFIPVLSKIVDCIDPNKVEEILDFFKIPKDGSNTTGDNFKCGELVPLVFHQYLVNEFVELDNGEIAALSQGSDDEEVFIYVKVIACTFKNDENKTLSMYRVQISEDPKSSIIECQAYQLYRFRAQWESKIEDYAGHDNYVEDQKAVVYSGEEKPAEHEKPLPSFEDVIKEIDKILKDALKMSEKERTKIHRRLYLKWHPDKHPESRKTFATKVFQYLKGKIESSDKNADQNFSRWSSQSSYPEQDFDFEDLFGHFSSHNRSRGTSQRHWSPPPPPKKNPQPAEARRWLRQAKQDIQAALQSGSYEWISFTSLKAAEKALKAAIYLKDYKQLDERNISMLSYHIDNDEIRRYASELSKILQSEDHLMYPHKWMFPNIPNDMIKQEISEKALKIAKKIVEMVEDIIQGC